MAYDRAGTGSWAWLKGVGTQEEPLHRDWRVHNDYLLRRIWFSRFPRSIRGGDLLVYYAAGLRVMPAIVEIVSNDVMDEASGHPVHGQRFRWAMGVRPIITVDVDRAPALHDTPIASTRVMRLSYLLLSSGEYGAIRDMLIDVAREESNRAVGTPLPLGS